MSALLRRVDHLIYGTADLYAGVERLESLLGVRATPGGQHPGMGTRNALISLGAKTYLEIMAPDPEQPAPAAPRWFGIDQLGAPKLVAWVANGTALGRLVGHAAGRGITLGDVSSGSRRRPDGTVLGWQFTNPRVIVADGIVPFFIDWGTSPHPATGAAAGAALIGLRAEHPDAPRVQGMLRELGLELPVAPAPPAALVATIAGPHGTVELR